jgi:glycosyltransferase involved in cell wall biosynthesis
MKVLHIITESNMGGAQGNTLLTMQGLVSNGCEVHLACGPRGPGEGGALASEAEKCGVKVTVVRSLVRPISPIRDLLAVLAIGRVIARARYDVVHTHSFKAGLIGRVAAWFLGVPRIVHTFHGVPFDTRTVNWKTRLCFFAERLACLFCHRLVTVGEVLRDELIAHNVATPEKIVTIRSGVDFSRLGPYMGEGSVRLRLGVPANVPVIGFVGRLVEQKAPEVLLRAFALVRARVPSSHLIYVGEGPLRDELVRAAGALGLDDCVHLTGERRDVPRLLAAMDVFALPSRWEGVGRALTEAMYMKKAVVCTGVNGVPELVEDGVTGLIARCDDPIDLAEKIFAVIKDPARAGALGRAAHEKVRRLMSAQSRVKATIRLYEGPFPRKPLPTMKQVAGGSRVRHLRHVESR